MNPVDSSLFYAFLAFPTFLFHTQTSSEYLVWKRSRYINSIILFHSSIFFNVYAFSAALSGFQT